MGFHGYYFNMQGSWRTCKFPHCYVALPGTGKAASWGHYYLKKKQASWGHYTEKKVGVSWSINYQ